MTDNRQAWADFWAGEGSRQTCLPRALQDIEDAQRALWSDFARTLPKSAQVLDLGTGGGAVLQKMRAVRPDLKLTGVDSSPTLPPPPTGISLRAGVPFEALPFPDGRFDAVTSQFGFEYGDTAATAPEVARVLRDGGRMVFAMHRRDGPILAHNLSRREALQWALGTGLLEKGRALAAARQTMALPTPPAFHSAPQDAARKFPNQPVAAEFLQALLQTLEMGRRRPPAETIEVLQTLESKARNEIARIATLERAACDEDRLASIISQLAAAGLSLKEPDSLMERSSRRAFAWILWGERRSS